MFSVRPAIVNRGTELHLRRQGKVISSVRRRPIAYGFGQAALIVRAVGAYRKVQRDGLHLGLLPELAASVDPSTTIILDHDLDIAPNLGRILTVHELANLVDDFAGRLWRVGIRPDDQVVIHKRPNADVWILECAVSRIGAVPVMLSHKLGPGSIEAMFEKLDHPSIITDCATFDAISSEISESIRFLMYVGTEGAVNLNVVIRSESVQFSKRAADQIAVVTHTSGTTATPKLVVHTPRTQAMRLRPQWWLLTTVSRKEVVAICIPFLHSRMVAAMALALLRGTPILLMKNLEPASAAGFLVRHRPGFIEALPATFMDWERLWNDARKPFSSVRVFSSTFDAIHMRTVKRLLGASQRRRPIFFQIYGQSEVGPATGRSYSRASVQKVKGRCVGWAVPFWGARVRIVSRNAERPTESSPGYIEVSWRGLAKTYYGDEALYSSNRRGAWWRTGDLGHRTRFGCLHVHDREADLIPVAGSCLDIEDQILDDLEELSELVIVGAESGIPIPVFTTHDDLPLDGDRWRRASSKFSVLGRPIQILESEMPRTGTLKVRRVALQRVIDAKAHDGS